MRMYPLGTYPLRSLVRIKPVAEILKLTRNSLLNVEWVCRVLFPVFGGFVRWVAI